MIRQAVVLCGGRGTRLAPVVGDLPKVLVPIDGSPLLARLFRDLRAAGVDDALLLAGWQGERVAHEAPGLAPPGLTVRTLVERAPRGTAGALLDAADHLAERFFLVYGDVCTVLDWRRFGAAAERNGGLATLLVHRTDHPADSDVVAVDDAYRLVAWRRKGSTDGAAAALRGAALGNAGVAVGHRDLLRRIPSDRASDLTADILPPLVDLRAPLHAYLSCEYVRDMGTPARLAQVEADLRDGRAFRRAALVLLDRDGVLNEEVGLIADPAQLRLLPGAAAAVRRLGEAGVATALVTNQPVAARGLCDEAQLDVVEAQLHGLLAAEGARLDATFRCPHHPETHHGDGPLALRGPCRCRKPGVGMVDDALAATGMPAWRTVVVGDRSSDLQMAFNAGLPSIAVDTGAGCRDGVCPARPTWRFADLSAAASWLLGQTE